MTNMIKEYLKTFKYDYVNLSLPYRIKNKLNLKVENYCNQQVFKMIK